MTTYRNTLGAKSYMSKISCFADCGESSLVIRVPYSLAIKLLNGLPEGRDREELSNKMKIAARRSNVFSRMLSEVESNAK